MAVIYRISSTPNTGSAYILGEALSYTQLDGNFAYLLTNMSGSNITITGKTNIVKGNLTVDGGVTASLQGTASYALYAKSASYALNVPTASVSASYATTASFAFTASYALNAKIVYSGSLSGSNVVESFNSESIWVFNHNLEYQDVVVQTYDNDNNQIIPQNIQLTDSNTVTITFSSPKSGIAIATLGGNNSFAISASYATTASYSKYSLTASYALNAPTASISASYAATASYSNFSSTASYALNVPTASVSASYAATASFTYTASYALSAGVVYSGSLSGSNVVESFSDQSVWNFAHNLNYRDVVIQVYDSGYSQVIPESVYLADANNATITFSSPKSGVAIATLGGNNSFATSASYAATASYVPGLNLSGISSGSISASVGLDTGSIFLIQSASVPFFSIGSDSTIVAYSDLFIIQGYTSQQPVLTVSGDIVNVATHSFDPTGSTTAGNIYFTSNSFYVGLE